MMDKKRIFEHVLFWGAYWFLLSLASGLYDLDYTTIGLYNLSLLPITVPFTYLFVYWILPRFFTEKTFLFILLSLLAFAVALFLKRLSTQYIQYPLLYGDSDYTFTFFNWYRIIGNLMQLAATVGIVAGFKYYRDWRKTKEKVNALQTEKQEAELSFLKAQIHPHFLFNTLNSIYYEVLRKSEEAPNLIIKLSDILRFTLYECNDQFIPAAKEIELIRSYIALEQSRYGDRLTVHLNVEGKTEKLIPPLICFSLVENAFKHGASENKDHSEIEISFMLREYTLKLEVRNPVMETEQADVLGASKGIGLENITRQLTLIFDDHYELRTEKEENRFMSTLEIPLQ